jgi:hypothetical protein
MASNPSALDLYAGSQSRPHGNLDIGLLRRDVREVRAALPSWEVFEINAMGASLWMMQLLLDESADDFWVFRRQWDIRPASLEGGRIRAREIRLTLTTSRCGWTPGRVPG